MLNITSNPKAPNAIRITKPSSLYNYYLDSEPNPNKATLLYTHSLVRNLLLRDPQTEIEFRALPFDGELYCPHDTDKCFCTALATIKNIVSQAPTHEEGLYLIASKYYPNIQLHYKQEKHTHINISQDSSTKLGRMLWDFLVAKFRINDSEFYTTLLEISGSIFLCKQDKHSLLLTQNGEIVNNYTILKKLMKEKILEDHDLISELLKNTLPFTMYTTVKYKVNAGPQLDVDDLWIAETVQEISDEIKEAAAYLMSKAI